MRQNTDKYQYKQLETYKEILELRHIKVKTLIVNIINIILAVIVWVFFYRLGVDSTRTATIIFLFVLQLLVNISFYAYENDMYSNLKIAMYFNTIFEYVIAVSLIVMFRTPSIFTALFLAYAITAVYQDYKVMITSNVLLFTTGFFLIMNFPNLFTIASQTGINMVPIILFLALFGLLLTLSSFILIKRKTFFYNHLAQIKEGEVRNIDVLKKVELLKTGESLNEEEYYISLDSFSEELSKKIGIENVFQRKIQILRDSKEMTQSELLSKYTEYSIEQLEQLQYMELSIHKKMRNIGMKASKSQDLNVSRKDIFSESQFKSFKHYNDHNYVKIISFVVFYVLLKVDKPYMKELSEERIKDMLYNSEYFHRVDRDIIEVYFANNEVFDTIVNDIMKERWHYEKNN